MKKKPLLRRLGESFSFLLLASAMQTSALAVIRHKPADPRSRHKPKHLQHGPRFAAHGEARSRRHLHPAVRVDHNAHTERAASAKPHASRFRQLGLASWYGRGFNGRRTANGEHFDMYSMTAAHRTLPLGSYVRVTSLSNARSVVVRINDRGPFARGRVIDLSYFAAAALGMHHAGVMKVEIERVEEPDVQRVAHRPIHLTTDG